MEVDPFEARMEFLTLLSKLNASQHSIQKVGNFAMRNRNLYEDLYSCIIEELEQSTSINAKMNIFYVLDSICHQSHKAGFSGYIDLIQRNLPKIVECVTPSGPKGNVNVPGTKKILESWRAKKVFPEGVIEKVEKPLSTREVGLSTTAAADSGFTKDDILKRMDEDRERHKRIREEIWIRPSDEDPYDEFLQYWEEVSDLDDNDYEDMESENGKYLVGYPWVLEFDRFLPSPGMFKHKAPSGSSEPGSNSGTTAIKRLTSPEGTASVSTLNTGTKMPTVTSATNYQHQHQHQHNGYQSQSTRDNPRSYPTSHSSHHHQHSSSHHTYSSSSSSSHSQSRNHSYSYYDSSTSTGPDPDTTTYRTSPSSTFSSHSRSQHHERKLSSSANSHVGYANGYGDHVP